MADWHGMKGMWVDRMLDPCCDFNRSPLPWHWPWIFKVKFWKSRISGMLDLHCDFKLWPHPWPSLWIFKVKILKLLYLRNGMVDSLGMKGMWVGYDVGCTMGLTLGHGGWQIDQPSNGSMWNSYNFQPVGQWMGYWFTDLGAEGCCRSLNVLFNLACLAVWASGEGVALLGAWTSADTVLTQFRTHEYIYSWGKIYAKKTSNEILSKCRCFHSRI